MIDNKLKKQIVFSDYDGTIYITEKDMEKNVKSIEEYRYLGGKFVIVTGRSKSSVRKVIEKYNIPYDYVISNNGAIIFDNAGNKIYEQSISIDVSSKIINYLKSIENIEIYYYNEDDTVEDANLELLKIRVKTNDTNIANDIENKINSLFENEVIAHATFPSMYYDDISYSLVDIVSVKAGKEKAINKLLETLDIQKQQAITIGDGRNDIAMIKEFYGYSMITAEDEVKKVASKIFKSIDEALEDLKK